MADPSLAESSPASIEEASTSHPVTIDPVNLEAETHLQILTQAVRTQDLPMLKSWGMAIVQSHEFWIDIGLIALSILIALTVSRLLLRAARLGKLPNLTALLKKIPSKKQLSTYRISLVLITWFCLLLANTFGFTCPLLRAYSLIVTLFVFINMPSKFIEWKSWMSVITSIIFVIAALHVLGVLDNVTNTLDTWSLELGSVDLSVLDIIKGVFAFTILFWAAGFISSFITKRVSAVQDLSPNVKVLLTKSIRVGLSILAFLITFGIMGLKLTTLTVFGGAFGLGLGFGLQKVISNLVSGIILLLDKSIKPGDVVEIGSTYGWINSLNLRYASVITRDNKEHLIPNEDLITNPVVNWSYSSKLVRVRAPFGISYQSDIRLAMELAESAAKETSRIVETPSPRCNLMGFGDSSVDLELRFWIEDPHNGVGRVRSDALLRIWDLFHENGIEFPFPQRDINFKDSDRELLEKFIDRASPPAQLNVKEKDTP